MSETAPSTGSLQRLLAALAPRVPNDVVCELSPAEALASGGGDGGYANANDAYTLVVGEVAFAGSMQSGALPRELRVLAGSRRADLLGLAWSLRALRAGGRAVLVVPESVLSASTQAHRAMRRQLIEDNALDAVIRLAPGWYRPRVGAAILVCRKGGATESVWFYDLPPRPRVRVSKRTARAETAPPLAAMTADMVDLVTRWEARMQSERDRGRRERSFCVAAVEIMPPAFELGLAHYRADTAHVESTLPRPHELLAEIAGLEAEIFEGIRQLVGMLK